MREGQRQGGNTALTARPRGEHPPTEGESQGDLGAATIKFHCEQ